MNRKFIIWCFLAGVIVLLPACSGKRINAAHAPHWFDHYNVFHKKEYLEFFTSHIGMAGDTLEPMTALIYQYYQEENHTPFWTLRGIQENRIDTMLHYLEHSYEHGIAAEYFNYADVVGVVDSLKNHFYSNDKNIYNVLYRLEIGLTRAFVKYVTALTYGATDPKAVNGGKWLMETYQPDSAFVMQTLKNMKSLPEAIGKSQPNDEDYSALQKELNRLLALKDTTWKEITDRVVLKGGTSDALKQVCRRLRITGELPASFRDTTVLTDQLLKGINKFRRNNAIPESDSLDIETINKLNRPISYYTDKLAVNMERLRWQINPAKGDTCICVNIPDFTLRAVVGGEMVFKTRICCGKTQNPKLDPARMRGGLVRAFKSESPLLYSRIGRIVLNPEWNIPYDIIKNEYYQKLCKSNTAVVRREHLFVKDIRTGHYVIPDSIDWTKVSQNNIPYRLHQSSGRYNALGQIKFDFPNSESVYLHDTNRKGAFKSRTRAFSHGCIRVENPFDLAQVLYELNGFDTIKTEQLGILVGKKPTTEEGEEFVKNLIKQDSIREARIADAERPFFRKLKPTSVSLKYKMPLYIEYYTCFVDSEGSVQYRDDVYYKDGNILRVLKGIANVDFFS